MNDFLISHLISIVENSQSEIARISAIKQLQDVNLDEYFERTKQTQETEPSISEEEALKLLEE